MIKEHHLCGDFDLSIDHKHCDACIDVRMAALANNPVANKDRLSFRFRTAPNRALKFWMGRAQGIVGIAKKRGLLAVLDGEIQCSDCDLPAVVYDHRDYGKPLDVSPVCLRCNRIRGAAIYPSPRSKS